jgi:nitroimidazol reductase NimA-like FMN-containing flavoprotein (pyridoxamine 5'-phosphate oxidase superfamily)
MQSERRGASSFVPTSRSKVARLPARASYDRALAYSILDEALFCSVGFALEGRPFVIPMAYARWGDRLILHGALASRLLKSGAGGVALAVSVTLLDGLVLARSAFHHSLNYRSVVIFGTATELVDREEKLEASCLLVEHVQKGRAAACRPPNEKELAATRILSLPIEEASIKVRKGGPLDDDADLDLECWAGHLPLTLSAGAPVPDAAHPPHSPIPEALLRYQR